MSGHHKWSEIRRKAAKFQVNDVVRILQYPEDGIDGYGRVDQVSLARAAPGGYIKRRRYRYHVVNGNMPFQGTVNDWFEADELRLRRRHSEE